MAVRQTDKSQEIPKPNPALNLSCCDNKHVGVSEVPRVSSKCALPGFCQRGQNIDLTYTPDCLV